jgi:hypothetical protein
VAGAAGGEGEVAGIENMWQSSPRDWADEAVAHPILVKIFWPSSE